MSSQEGTLKQSGLLYTNFLRAAGHVAMLVMLGQAVPPPGWHCHVCTTSVIPGTPSIHPAPTSFDRVLQSAHAESELTYLTTSWKLFESSLAQKSTLWGPQTQYHKACKMKLPLRASDDVTSAPE